MTEKTCRECAYFRRVPCLAVNWDERGEDEIAPEECFEEDEQ